MTVGPVDRDEQTAAFFDGTAAGQLLLRRCPDGHYSEPQAAQCTTCGRLALEWAAASGGASLVSWAVSWFGDVATVLVIAELDEGPWWWSQLAGAEPAGLSAGTRLRLAFARPDTGPGETAHEAVPVFELAG
jgi:uncharacterized OB-fold protein